MSALADLTHLRWSLPVVAECAGSPVGGLKHATLLHRLGISRDSLGRTLRGLIEQGWLTNNPGVGHALRPEYVLTGSGQRIGAAARRIMRELNALDAAEVGLDKWTLPVLAAAGEGAARFGDFRLALSAITPRALALCLSAATEAGLMNRTVYDDRPPTVEYRASRRALKLVAASKRLAMQVSFRLHGPRAGDDARERVRLRRAV